MRIYLYYKYLYYKINRFKINTIFTLDFPCVLSASSSGHSSQQQFSNPILHCEHRADSESELSAARGGHVGAACWRTVPDIFLIFLPEKATAKQRRDTMDAVNAFNHEVCVCSIR